ncbi:MAG: alpha-amylase family glycosyl hydrolase [Caulobacteraceae bacterium]
MAEARPADLRLRDRNRGQWWLQGGVVGYSAYVDHFSGDLRRMQDKLPYLKDLGVSYLHLLPLLKARQGENDGGFAVSDFGVVDPRFGTNADLEDLARKAHQADLALVIDLVCNHSADDHPWAKAARAGDEQFKDYYVVVPDLGTVEAYEASLIDVFPDVAPGNFTHAPEMGGWVWTTFYPFQWDLNYANPAVFGEMTAAMLRLANLGVDGLRLDSAPFLWKRLGTNCRNLPEVHWLLAAWRAILAIAAPSVVLKAEAIERLEDVTSYFGCDVAEQECHLAYNNGAMTALWAALALGEAEPVRRLVEAAARKPVWGTWVNYVRCHDDIIWSALTPYLSVDDQRRCSDFFAGQTPGSFSAGVAFQAVAGVPPSTNGMTAALVGLLGEDPPPEALQRLYLLYGVSFALDGFPLIWMGDEIALPGAADGEGGVSAARDGRWLQRPFMDWERAALHGDPATLAGRVFTRLATYARIRGGHPAFHARHSAKPSKSSDPTVLSFVRGDEGAQLQCLANFSGGARKARATLDGDGWFDLLSQDAGRTREVDLGPYQVRWLVTPHEAR